MPEPCRRCLSCWIRPPSLHRDARALAADEVGWHCLPAGRVLRVCSDRPLIELGVQPGQRVAIRPHRLRQDPLINLLMRFYDLMYGEIVVSGTETRQLTRASPRRSYGMVLQETCLQERHHRRKHRLRQAGCHSRRSRRRQRRLTPTALSPACPRAMIQ